MTWTKIISLHGPELILIGTACVLFLLGMAKGIGARRLVPVVALASMFIVFAMQFVNLVSPGLSNDAGISVVHVGGIALYIRVIATWVGVLMVLLAWPTNEDCSGNSALNFGRDAGGEFFALMLLAFSGILLVAGADDLIILFLGIELASIPTYIMVSISRPLPVAQEAGVKYFFLGAMAAALLLFGFSYIFGATGTINLDAIAVQQSAGLGSMSAWLMLGAVMLIAGLAFKLAAFPLHFYAGDVYEGAATPVTAMLSFVPKTTGIIALLKVLYAISGGRWMVPPELVKTLWIIAAFTMTAGNTLGILQQNIKRMLAYSSVAHSGYMLVGITALVSQQSPEALQGVLFYLASYGVMSVAAFGVLMLLPARKPAPATSAETLDDLAGVSRQHPGLALAMAVACFSLMGLPLTMGFWGKFYLIRAAMAGKSPLMVGLAIVMMINAAIGAAYYLRVVGVMFLRPPTPAPAGTTVSIPSKLDITSAPILAAILISTGATLLFGMFIPATDLLHTQAWQAAQFPPPGLTPVVSASR
jgi:NADH-quinone oxidoreductase subunit N